MADGLWHFKNGKLLFSGGRVNDCGCCPGGPGGCVPPAGPGCPCSPGCSEFAGQIRRLRSQTNAGISEAYSIAYPCCCGPASGVRWTVRIIMVFYDKGQNCAGLAERWRLEISGAGTGPGIVSARFRGLDESWTPFDRSTQIANGPRCLHPEDFFFPTSTVPVPPFLAICLILGVPYDFFGLMNALWPAGSSAPDNIVGALYQDCTAFSGNMRADAGLASSNPCSGLLTVSTIDIRAMGCAPESGG